MARKDVNAPERVEGEEVSVTGDDVGSTSAYGEFEKHVVLGVPAGRYPQVRIDPFRFPRESGEESSNVFVIDVPAEPLPA